MHRLQPYIGASDWGAAPLPSCSYSALSSFILQTVNSRQRLNGPVPTRRQQQRLPKHCKLAAGALGTDTKGAPFEAHLACGTTAGPFASADLLPGQHGPQFPAKFYDLRGRLVLKNLRRAELEQWCVAAGEERRRAAQLWRWMYYDGMWAKDLESTAGLQGGFSRAFRDKAAGSASLDGGLSLQSVTTAADGTRKLVFRLVGGEGDGGLVETVLIPIVRQAGHKLRTTICVSSQVGCAMGCQFCYTGTMGLAANLSAAQIVEQAVQARRLVAQELEAEGRKMADAPLTNIVFMGMGEPLHNLDAVLRAVDILCDPHGLHFSYNKVTVSTVGLVPEIRQLCSSSKAQLAVSLHAANDQVRDEIVPVNRRYPLSELMGCLEELYPRKQAVHNTVHKAGGDAEQAGRGTAVQAEAAAVQAGSVVGTSTFVRGGGKGAGGTGRGHVLFEYVMLRGVNDSEDDARQLLELTQRVEAKYNLIVFNPHEGTRFQASTPEAVKAFRSVLILGGRVATVRDSRGDDTMAACGQLGDPQALRSRRQQQQQQATRGSAASEAK